MNSNIVISRFMTFGQQNLKNKYRFISYANLISLFLISCMLTFETQNEQDETGFSTGIGSYEYHIHHTD